VIAMAMVVKRNNAFKVQIYERDVEFIAKDIRPAIKKNENLSTHFLMSLFI
jgi:hypothetical protein